ncbi:unnamed protein product [Victoria cruziana]
MKFGFIFPITLPPLGSLPTGVLIGGEVVFTVIHGGFSYAGAPPPLLPSLCFHIHIFHIVFVYFEACSKVEERDWSSHNMFPPLHHWNLQLGLHRGGKVLPEGLSCTINNSCPLSALTSSSKAFSWRDSWSMFKLPNWVLRATSSSKMEEDYSE